MADVIITLKVDGTSVPVHPVFGGDLKVKVSKQKDQVFHRTSIEGKVQFVGGDFDIIASCSHNSILTIEVSNGSGIIGSCDFIKSDTTLDYDNKVATVKIVTKDQYEDFLAKYDNKYNLVNLKPTIESISLIKRPILQFYALGDTKLTNVFGNMSFEVNTVNEAESKNDTQLVGLGFTNLFHRVLMTVTSSTIPLSANGDYVGAYSGSLQDLRLTNPNGYYWKYDTTMPNGTWKFLLYDSNGNRVVTQYLNEIYIVTPNTVFSDFYIERTIYGTASGGTATIGEAELRNRNIYGRLLIDADIQISGWVDSPIAISSLQGDIYDNSNSNYSYVCGITSFDGRYNVVSNTNKTETPTKYYYKEGLYYAIQSSYYARGVAFPIGPSMWAEESFWYVSSPEIEHWLDEMFDVYYTLRDAFPLHSAISVLLESMGVPYTFSNSDPYSKFLYGIYPSDGLIDTIPTPRMRGNYIYITPITNVKKTRYEQAAQRGDITLKQILDMLRNVYQCYWYLDGVGRLCIEHISFFKNNHAYGLYTPEPLIDLTSMKDMPNGKMWDFDTNTMTFDRSNCPSRYEFGWGGDVTEQFNGYPIDILDKPADGGSKEKMTVTNFTADIDFSVINPKSVSDDIYAVFEANATTHQVDIVDVSLGDNGALYNIQNGYLSFLFAEQYYWPYDLGGWDAVIDNRYKMPVYAVRHLIEQEVGVPLSGRVFTIPDTLEVIKTGLGVGLLKSADINADTLYANSKLTFQAEKDDYRDSITVGKGPYTHGSYALTIVNYSNTSLVVRYSYNGVVSTISLNANSGSIVATGGSTLDPNDVVILSAVQDTSHNYCIGDVLHRYGTHITEDISQNGLGITAEFDGNGYTGGEDFAYIKVRIVKASTVTITPSTENDFDIGYVASKPCVSKSQVQSVGGTFASGSTVATVNIPAGQDVYIGYSKDSSSVGGNDKVTIVITEN